MTDPLLEYGGQDVVFGLSSGHVDDGVFPRRLLGPVQALAIILPWACPPEKPVLGPGGKAGQPTLFDQDIPIVRVLHRDVPFKTLTGGESGPCVNMGEIRPSFSTAAPARAKALPALWELPALSGPYARDPGPGKMRARACSIRLWHLGRCRVDEAGDG